MYRHISDFLTDWGHESASTIKLLKNLSDESLTKKVHPKVRTLGFLAWHLIQTIPEMMGNTGLKIDGPAHTDKTPSSAKEITEAFKKSSDSLIQEVEKNWKDDTLNTEDEMYGEKWKRGLTLLYLMLHQAHHRGQMTVLMRQAGLKVTGIYGPAKEEWAAMGMDPME